LLLKTLKALTSFFTLKFETTQVEVDKMLRLSREGCRRSLHRLQKR
jgi:DNA-binding Lrp family transcriptional regulator